MTRAFLKLTSVTLTMVWFMPVFGQFTVDVTTDGNDANPNDGICATIDGNCTFSRGFTRG